MDGSFSLGSMAAPDYFSHSSQKKSSGPEKEKTTTESDDSDTSIDLQQEGDGEEHRDINERTPFSSRTGNIRPNAGHFSNDLKGRAGSSEVDSGNQVKIDGNGVIQLQHSFDVMKLYQDLKRSKRSQTVLTIMCCRFAPGSNGESKKTLCFGLSTGEVEIVQYDSQNGDARISQTLIDKDVNSESVNCTDLVWLPDAKHVFASYTNGYVKLWNVASRKCLISKYEKDVALPSSILDKTEEFLSPNFKEVKKNVSSLRQVLCLAVSSDAVPPSQIPDFDTTDERDVNILITGGSDGIIFSWLFLQSTPGSDQKRDGKRLPSRELKLNKFCMHSGAMDSMDGHTMKVFALCFDPLHPTNFFSGGWDGVIFRWDAITGECLQCIKGPVICSNESLQLHPKQQSIMLAADHNTGSLDILHMNISKGSSLESRLLMSPKQYVMPYCCHFLGNDKIIVGGSGPNCLRVISRRPKGSSAPGQDRSGEAVVLASLEQLSSAVTSVDLVPLAKGGGKQLMIVCSGSHVYTFTVASL